VGAHSLAQKEGKGSMIKKEFLSSINLITLTVLSLAAMQAAVAQRAGNQNRSARSLEVAGPQGPPACVRSKQHLEQNVQTVVSYYTMAFNDGLPEQAVEMFVGIDENGNKLYTQHNPFAADGPEAFIAFVQFFKGLFPELNVNIVRTIAQCDLVMTHSHITTGPDDIGNSAMDIFRLDSTGRIIEHWDAVQPVEPNPANDNTMF
jgi:predicted SnoaL-like aldol condensation-catalyzing enzyme